MCASDGLNHTASVHASEYTSLSASKCTTAYASDSPSVHISYGLKLQVEATG